MDTQLTATKPITALSIDEARKLPARLNPAEEAKRLDRILTPASDVEIGEAISFMFNILPMATPQGASEMKILREGYLIALRGQPRWSIMEARDAFIRGQVADYNSSFAPNAADLGREVARRVDEYRMKLGRAVKAAAEAKGLEVEERCGPRSPALKARGDAVVARLRAEADADRQRYFGRRAAPEWVEQNPITPEAMAAAEGMEDAPVRDGVLAKAPVPDAFANLSKRRA